MNLEKIKVLILGIAVYLSKELFFKIGRRWFNELKDRNHFEDRADTIRKNFWKAFLRNIIVVCGTVSILVISGKTNLDKNLVLRIVAIILALTASLGRGGWEIQSSGGTTIVERIDRGMFTLSQLGATVLLLFVITMK